MTPCVAPSIPESRFHFTGSFFSYANPDVPGPLPSHWGSGYAELPHRKGRPKPGLNAPCPYCVAGDEPEAGPWPCGLLRFGGTDYRVRPNRWPLVQDQLLVFPVDDRPDVEAVDVALVLRLVGAGFAGLEYPPAGGLPLPRPDSPRYAAYVNATPDSGRSIAHLHVNLVPSDGVPLPDVTPPDWDICSGMGAATVSRLVGLPFYVLTVRGPEHGDVAQTVAALHQLFRAWGVAYNLLAFGPPDDPADVCLAVVPRSAEHAQAVDQRVAGLEFLTGVLVPGPGRKGSLSAALRDEAFRQVTLQGDQRLALERRLRAAFGLPPAYAAVVAVPQAG